MLEPIPAPPRHTQGLTPKMKGQRCSNTLPHDQPVITRPMSKRLAPSVGRKVTDEEAQAICARYLSGESSVQLGRAFCLSSTSVLKILQRCGVEARNQSLAASWRRKLTDEQTQTLCDRYQAGEGSVQLGAAFGITSTSVLNILQRCGVKTRNQKVSCEIEGEVCRRYLAGESTHKLGAAFGVSSKCIGSILARNGIDARGKTEHLKGVPLAAEHEVCVRYLDGQSAVQIGAVFGVSSNCIGRILKRNGVATRVSNGYGDSVKHVLDQTGHHVCPRKCEFYLFELARYSATHCKPGIAFDVEVRIASSSADTEYGAEVLRLVLSTRAEAFFLEQAVLDATRGSADCPEDLQCWSGSSEVRAMPAEDIVPTVLRLAEELEQLGPWDFAARYVPMTASQRAICQQRAMQEVKA